MFITHRIKKKHDSSLKVTVVQTVVKAVVGVDTVVKAVVGVGTVVQTVVGKGAVVQTVVGKTVVGKTVVGKGGVVDEGGGGGEDSGVSSDDSGISLGLTPLPLDLGGLNKGNVGGLGLSNLGGIDNGLRGDSSVDRGDKGLGVEGGSNSGVDRGNGQTGVLGSEAKGIGNIVDNLELAGGVDVRVSSAHSGEGVSDLLLLGVEVGVSVVDVLELILGVELASADVGSSVGGGNNRGSGNGGSSSVGGGNSGSSNSGSSNNGSSGSVRQTVVTETVIGEGTVVETVVGQGAVVGQAVVDCGGQLSGGTSGQDGAQNGLKIYNKKIITIYKYVLI